MKENYKIYPEKYENCWHTAMNLPAYLFFNDAVRCDNLRYKEVLTFVELAKYIIREYEAGNQEVLNQFFVSKSVMIKTNHGQTMVCPKGRKDLFRKGDWLIGDEVFQKVNPQKGFMYEGVLRECMLGNWDYHNHDKCKRFLEAKTKNVSDWDLLVGLMGGDEVLAREFKEVANPDLTQLHKGGGTGHGKNICLLIGIVKNRITPFFYDDSFRFVVKERK